MQVLQARFCEQTAVYRINLKSSEGNIRAYLFDAGAIESEEFENNGDMHLKLLLSSALLKRLSRRFEIDQNRFETLADTLAGAA